MSDAGAPGLWDDSIPNQSPALVIISVAFLLVSTAFFAARLAWRFNYKQRGWDDLMATAAWVTLVVQTAFGGMAAHYGFGKHRANIPSTFSHAMFYFYLYQILYKMLGAFTKLTFCSLYLRLFQPHKKFTRLVWINTAIIIAGGIAFTAVTIWQCNPIRRAWDRREPGSCVNNMAFWYSHASFNTLMDVVVFLLPIPLIRHLQVAERTRKGLIALFSLGFFTITASVVRLAMLSDSAKSDTDPTWGSMRALIWTEIESNTSMICCCLPALRKLATKLWRKATGQTSSSIPHETGTATKTPSAPGPRVTLGKSNRHNNPNPVGFGNFTEIRASPPPRSPVLPRTRGGKRRHHNDHDLAPGSSSSSSGSGRRQFLHHILRPFSPKRPAPTNNNNNTHHHEARDGVDRSHLAPKLELGQLYKDTGYRGDDSVRDYVPAWQPSSRMSVGGPPRDARARVVESTAEMADWLKRCGPDDERGGGGGGGGGGGKR